jgi:hypothetical protein
VKAKVTQGHDRHFVLKLPPVVELCYYLRNWKIRAVVSVAFCAFSDRGTVL